MMQGLISDILLSPEPSLPSGERVQVEGCNFSFYAPRRNVYIGQKKPNIHILYLNFSPQSSYDDLMKVDHDVDIMIRKGNYIHGVSVMYFKEGRISPPKELFMRRNVVGRFQYSGIRYKLKGL